VSEVVTRDCPTAETLAAFIDGNATDEERGNVQRHLETCRECMSVVRETAAFEREELSARGVEEGESVVPMRRTPAWWMAVAAGVGIAVVGGYAIRQVRPSDPLRELYAAAAKVEYRPVEGRVHGMEFRPMAPVERSGSPSEQSPAALKLRGAAGELLEKAGTAGDASSMHAVGVARLVTGDEWEAVQQIEAAIAKDQSNAAFWNDLAVARLRQAGSRRDRQALELALTAAGRALEIQPRLAEAAFNRALALEALGRQDDAEVAYRDYLKIDASSEWSGEVRDRLSRMLRQSAVIPLISRISESMV